MLAFCRGLRAAQVYVGNAGNLVGCGSKLQGWGYAGCSLWFHLAVGPNQWYQFGVGAPPILVPSLVGIESDVHWGEDLDFDPWPFAKVPFVVSMFFDPQPVDQKACLRRPPRGRGPRHHCRRWPVGASRQRPAMVCRGRKPEREKPNLPPWMEEKPY